MSSFLNNFSLNIANMVLQSSSQHQIQLNYAYLITCLETYLSETLWGVLEEKPNYYLELGKSNTNSVKIVNLCNDGLETTIKNQYDNVQFHNLPQIKILFKKTFNIDFPNDMTTLYQAVSKRHDIVHRCGKSKTGAIITLSEDDLIALKDAVVDFVQNIDIQLESIVYQN